MAHSSEYIDRVPYFSQGNFLFTKTLLLYAAENKVYSQHANGF